MTLFSINARLAGAIIMQMRNHILGHLSQLVRFVAVGAVGFAAGLAVLTGLHGLAGVNYLVAYVASFFAANAAGYVLNAYFTFSTRSVNRAGAARYMTINAVILCANTVALELLVERAHIWYVTAAVILAIAATPVTFVAHRLLTYRLTRRSAPAPDPRDLLSAKFNGTRM